ncbi:hypothetical protein M8J77_014971 [Diaphorina citri]|nr:hypothetical protein M8J77_014971 [Diaphorina citri]
MSFDSINIYRSSIENILNDKSQVWHPCLCIVEQKCGISKTNMFLVVCFLLVIYLMFGMGAALLCNLIGFIYPACQTVKTMCSPNLAKNIKWLTYWLIFASISLVDHFSDWLEALFPLYWLIKCVFLLWCMSDICSNGSYVIYSCFLKPMFLSDKCFAVDCAIKEQHIPPLNNKYKA